MKLEKYTFVVAAIDGEKNQKAAAEYQIKGYPTFKFFVDGSEIEFDQERKTEKMLEFMNFVKDINIIRVKSIK